MTCITPSCSYTCATSGNGYDLSFNVTAEMIRESNQSLVAMNDQTDFVVASNMASLFLGQMSENPDLIPLFSELLSNQGEEILLAKAKHLRLAGTYSIAQLRMTALSYDYTFIGYVDNYSDYIFNPPLEETITLDGDDYLILIGEATVLEEG